METNQPKSVAAGEGLTLQSGPGAHDHGNRRAILRAR